MDDYTQTTGPWSITPRPGQMLLIRETKVASKECPLRSELAFRGPMAYCENRSSPRYSRANGLDRLIDEQLVLLVPEIQHSHLL